MATALPPQATPSNDGSLESAAQAFKSLLALDGDIPSSDTERTTGTPPEPRSAPPIRKSKATAPESTKPIAEQAPAAPEEEEASSASEQADDDAGNATDAEADTAPVVRTFKVKLPEGEQEVPEEEVIKGYLRTADYTRKTQELATERKTFREQEVTAVRAEREQYRTALTQVEAVLTALNPAEPNWSDLRQQLAPDDFAARVLSWKETQDRIGAIKAERTRLETQQREEAEAGYHAYVQDERAKLARELPAFADPVQAKTLSTDLSTYAKSKGFTDEDLAQVTDHRLVLLLHDAMQFQRAQANAPRVAQKIENALVTAPPGASRQNAPRTSKLDAAKARLRQSGSIDDAAAAFAEII